MSKIRLEIPASGGGTPYALDLEDEGVIVVSNPSAINFTGSGVTVIENPSGTAEVAISATPYALDIEGQGVLQTSNPDTINFVGAGVSVIENPVGTAEVTIAGGNQVIQIQDEGLTAATNPSFINFTGDGVSAIGFGGGVSVNVPAFDIQDEGTTIIASQNTNAINFVGAGVVVTESPSGTAEVSIAGGGLTDWSEGNAPPVGFTQNSVFFSPNNAATNVNAVLRAKGTGATIAQVPDGLTTGGNARGDYATDFQKLRTLNTKVASGQNSGILAGSSNQASGTRSFVGAGSSNTASGLDSAIVGGNSHTATTSRCFVGGGNSNDATGIDSAVLGGNGNNATATNSSVSGGASNTASGTSSSITGGEANAASSPYSRCAGYFGQAFLNYMDVFSYGQSIQFFRVGGEDYNNRSSGSTFTLFTLPINGRGAGTNAVFVLNIKTTFYSLSNASPIVIGDSKTIEVNCAVKRVGATRSFVGTPSPQVVFEDANFATLGLSLSISGSNLVGSVTMPTFSGSVILSAGYTIEGQMNRN